jgi:hypothetical protein
MLTHGRRDDACAVVDGAFRRYDVVVVVVVVVVSDDE